MIMANIRLALASIRTARLRNLFTMLGVIIGVASVVTTVSLGEGVRQQVKNQVTSFGKDLIIVSPGDTVSRDEEGKFVGFNFLANVNTSILTQQDLDAVESANGVVAVTPISIINGKTSYEDTSSGRALAVATTSNFAEIVRQKMSVGSFLSQNDDGRNFAVIGSNVANELFRNSAPVGRSITFRDQQFLVKGVFEEFNSSIVSPGINFNDAVFIPYATGQAFAQDRATIFQVFAQAESEARVDGVRENIERSLEKERGGETDFTVLKQEETIRVTNDVVTLLTGLIAAVATVSLIVGGIGIMNVMFVSVTERTHEIGVRKAVGATNHQIMTQFLTEAVVLTVVGSIIGVILAFIANLALRFTTDLKPVITPQVIAISILLALVVGILFGVLPANKAAKKDPITALRNE